MKGRVVAGFTMVELVASAGVSVLISGLLIVMLTSLRQANEQQMALGEVSVYADTAMYALKQDVGRSVAFCANSTSDVGSDGCPTLTNFACQLSGGAWIAYRLNPDPLPDDPANIRMDRVDTQTAQTTVVARRIQITPRAGFPGEAVTAVDLSQNPLVTLTIVTLRTVNGRAYRRVLVASYRRQI